MGIKTRIKMRIKTGIRYLLNRVLGVELSILHEVYWSQIYNNTIQNSSWLQDKSVSPGRWAVGYNYLYVLYRILDDIRPVHILELGLGQSTKIIGQYASFSGLSGQIKHIVVEHDDEWCNFFFKRNKALCQNTQVITLPLIDIEQDGEIFKAYDGFERMIHSLDMKFSVLSIDGPLGSSEHWGRRDILSCLPDCLDVNFAIIFDDYGKRESTSRLVRDVEAVLYENKIEFVKGIYPGVTPKGVCVLVSTSWKFLASL